MLKIQVSKGGKIFVARHPTNGRVQKAFGEQIGKPAGACVRSGVRKGMSSSAIHAVARDCTKGYAGTKLRL